MIDEILEFFIETPGKFLEEHYNKGTAWLILTLIFGLMLVFLMIAVFK